MTRREWNTNDGWEVAAGWDRPLQHYFIDISRKCNNCDGQGGFGEEPNDADQCPVCEGSGVMYAFNNLDDMDHTDVMGGMTLDQVIWVLENHLTEYPKGLLGILKADQVTNMGNDIRQLGTVGETKNPA